MEKNDAARVREVGQDLLRHATQRGDTRSGTDQQQVSPTIRDSELAVGTCLLLSR